MKLQEKTRTVAGVWHNQHNSEARFEIDAAGKISGTFVTGVGADGKGSETFPLTGFAEGDMVAFCVDFGKYRCMTSWVGQVTDSDFRNFTAMWHMASTNHAHPEQTWKSIWTGEDTFQSGARPSSRSQSRTAASHPMYCDLV